ncbi:protein-disulfide reductase DsbD [Novilysobacter arseniciresistens]|uniref:protein-disulfide reductase DsbD n=1 Tax=Novilysobacter arseniciresistens TaxID=1385522 RepID=UPI00068B98F5|nr:protein-disulfide reductase DsbD [Lysobacter arseniciresistens]
MTEPRTAGRWLALLLGLVALTAQAAIDPEDLLPVDEAFALAARPAADGAIEIRWDIADGYYLYRHRTSVAADAGFAAGELRMPAGTPYEDEFFGKVETYRDRLVATLPGEPRAASTVLTVKYQGCADAGICYPPQTRRITVQLPAGGGVDPVPGAAGAGLLGGVGTPGAANPVRLPGNPLLDAAGGFDEPLPPEQAFGFEAIADDGDTLRLRFSPAPGYYLYRDQTTLALAGGSGGVSLGRAQWPQGRRHRDGYFGETVVYFDPVEVTVPLRRATATATTIRLRAGFQGCQNDGICYPPMTRTVEVALPALATVSAGAAASAPSGVAESGSASASAADGAAADGAIAEDRPLESGSSVATQDSPGPIAAGSIDNGAGSKSETGAFAAAGDTSATDTATRLAEDSRLAAALSGPDRWWALLSFFGFGLLLSFTPCVLPMIPILSGLIAGASAGHERGLGAARALGLSFVYVLSSALVFTVAGVVAGLVGANLQIAFQNPWVLAAFAALFVALALSSFGLYELQLPAGLRRRLGALSDRQRGGSLAGVAVMGALSALIVGPCVAPPLAAAVLYIGQTQDPVFGGAALFMLAMGMGVPLLAFGVAAGKGLPTSGPWMVAVQRAFGFVFLGLAVWMVSRVLPGPVALGLWGALLIAAAATLALAAARSQARDWLRVLGWTAAGLLAIAGATQVVGALAGGSDPLRPLDGLRGGAVEDRKLPFRMIKSLEDLDREVAAAAEAGQPLMFDFYADWCVSCKEMEKYTFPEPVVHAALADFVLLKADVTANDAVDQALMKRLGIIGPPATLFYIDGEERRDLRLFGFERAADFAARADRANPDANR